MVEDLDKLTKEIVDYLQNENLSIFYGMSISAGVPTEIQWTSDEKDWHNFLEVAKNEGVKTIILDIAKESEASLSQYLKDESLIADEETRKQAREYNSRIKSYLKFAEKTAVIHMLWIKASAIYRYTIPADCWRSFIRSWRSKKLKS